MQKESAEPTGGTGVSPVHADRRCCCVLLVEGLENFPHIVLISCVIGDRLRNIVEIEEIMADIVRLGIR